MVRRQRLFLILLVTFAGALFAAESQPSKPAPAATVTIHRCVDGKGHVTLQDEACPAGSQDSAKVMTRPKDAPTRPPPAVPPVLPVEPAEPPTPPPARVPPPDMFVCTSYDGIERYSESYDPNPRCEPYVLYYPYPIDQPPQRLACRWVEDSCVRVSEARACSIWEQKRKDAESDARRAFSDTAAYRKSELARITRIVDDSCR